MRTKYLLLLLIPFIGGCFSIPNDKTYHLESNRIVQDSKIYQNNQLLAEVFYFGTYQNSHRGVVIYYPQDSKSEWLYPKNGESLFVKCCSLDDLQTLAKYKDPFGSEFLKLTLGRNPTKDEVIFKRCKDVKISNDGKYIYYVIPGLFFDTSHSYLIKSGH